jgi:sugar transferase (PEP-CTERM/EpsH1 system associated)
MSPPLVVHVIHSFAMGGMENGLVNLLNGFDHSLMRHAVICIEHSTDFAKRLHQPVPIYQLHRSQIGLWPMRRALFKLLRELKPGIVHGRNITALDAFLPAKLAGVPCCLYSEHGFDMSDPQGLHWKSRWLRKLHRPLIEHFITVSPLLADYLHKHIGVPRKHISPIMNGVDSERFTSALNPAKLPSHWDQNDLVLGTVGRMQSIKNQSLLLEALAALHRPDVRLLIAGDGPELSQLQAQAKALQIEQQVWLCGARSDVPELMKCLDLFILPSWSEGISNTILEAMSLGLPVLVSDVGGNPSLITDAALRFDPHSLPALLNVVTPLLDNPAQRLALGQANRQQVLAKHSLSVMTAHYQSTYQNALSRCKVSMPTHTGMN